MHRIGGRRLPGGAEHIRRRRRIARAVRHHFPGRRRGRERRLRTDRFRSRTGRPAHVRLHDLRSGLPVLFVHPRLLRPRDAVPLPDARRVAPARCCGLRRCNLRPRVAVLHDEHALRGSDDSVDVPSPRRWNLRARYVPDQLAVLRVHGSLLRRPLPGTVCAQVGRGPDRRRDDRWAPRRDLWNDSLRGGRALLCFDAAVRAGRVPGLLSVTASQGSLSAGATRSAGGTTYEASRGDRRRTHAAACRTR